MKESARRLRGVAAALAALALVAGCGGPAPPPPAVAPDVDLERYMGTWYEIARFEGTPFQEGCTGTTAEYTLRDDGRIDVANRCIRDGELDVAHGVARRDDAYDDPARLEVSFFWPFWGDYWILAVDEDHHALVGAPSRERLWVLAREPVLDEPTWERLRATAARRGYDVSRLVRTPQPPTLGPHAR
ncbi:MAG: lipocalin family protein [Myxococcota bacterium]|nr:lipocalin family protein [Myxococcota bacterium]